MFPSFISASADRDIGISFANIAIYQPGIPPSKRVLLTIDCDNEVGLSYYVDIRDVALPEFQHEKETVFFPYSGFEVKSHCENGDWLCVTLVPYDQQQICSENEV